MTHTVTGHMAKVNVWQDLAEETPAATACSLLDRDSKSGQLSNLTFNIKIVANTYVAFTLCQALSKALSMCSFIKSS